MDPRRVSSIRTGGGRLINWISSEKVVQFPANSAGKEGKRQLEKVKRKEKGGASLGHKSYIKVGEGDRRCARGWE